MQHPRSACSSVRCVYITPEVPFAATRMGRVAPGGVPHGGPRRQWAGRGRIPKAEQTGLTRMEWSVREKRGEPGESFREGVLCVLLLILTVGLACVTLLHWTEDVPGTPCPRRL